MVYRFESRPLSAFAWFQAEASITSVKSTSDTASVTVATTNAIDAGLKFTVTLDTETTTDPAQSSLTGVQLTNSSGETYYYDSALGAPKKGTLTKGYATAVFDVSVELTGSSNMALADALKIYYGTLPENDKNVYLRVTDSGQAVVSASTDTVYSACSENDQALTSHRTALVALALNANGTVSAWPNQEVYISVRNQTANDSTYNANTYTAGITATIGSATEAFTAA